MKKFLTTIMAAALLIQSAICVVAAPANLKERTVWPVIDLKVKATDASSWSGETTISSGQTVDLKATIDMEAVRTEFDTCYLLATAYFNGDETKTKALPVEGTFNVLLEYPQGVTLSQTTIDKTDMSDFDAATSDIFVADGARTVSEENGIKTLKIPFKVKSGITVGYLKDYENDNKAYFPDMEIVATGVAATTDGAPHHLYGELTGAVTYGDGVINAKINFKHEEPRPEAIIRVNDSVPPSGGGVTNYKISFETNGGTACTNVFYRSGRNITLSMLPVPEREGYTFAGWYMDAGLNEKADTFTLRKNITLYAAWTAVEAPGGEYVPELLNGADHFAYIIGYPDGTVQLNGSITRAEVATIFFRLLKDEVRDENLTYENDFVDVQEGAWYNGPISTLTALGILNGKDGDVFAPNSDITRGEFAAIVSRFAEKSAEVAHDFDDVDGHWAESDIYKAAAFGWIKGYEDNTFRPDTEITRAETMTLINRVLGRVPETTSDLLDDMAKWTDNKNEDTWFYIAVQEATNSHDYDRKENGYETWTKVNENRDWSTYEK